jgi:hypothetical protein
VVVRSISDCLHRAASKSVGQPANPVLGKQLGVPRAQLVNGGVNAFALGDNTTIQRRIVLVAGDTAAIQDIIEPAFDWPTPDLLPEYGSCPIAWCSWIWQRPVISGRVGVSKTNPKDTTDDR